MEESHGRTNEVLRFLALALLIAGLTFNTFAEFDKSYTTIMYWFNIIGFSVLVITLAVNVSKTKSTQFRISKLLSTILPVIGLFYLIGLTVSINNLLLLESASVIREIGKLLLAIKVPRGTEILPSLTFFIGLSYFLSTRKQWVYKNLLKFIVLGLILFIIGDYLFSNSLTLNIPTNWLALPILQYFLVYAFGLTLGHILEDGYINLRELKLQTVLVSGILLALGIFSVWKSTPNLWRTSPPGLGVLGLALTFCVLITAISTWKIRFRISNRIHRLISFVSESYLLILAISITTPYLLWQLDITISTSFIVYYLLIWAWAIVLAMTILAARKLLLQVRQRRLLQLVTIVISLAVTILAGFALYEQFTVNKQNQINQGQISNPLKIHDPWFDKVSRIAVKWQISPSCCSGFVEISFAHNYYVREKYSRSDGRDIRAVLTDGELTTELRFHLKDVDSDNTKIALDFGDIPESSHVRELRIYMGDLLNENAYFLPNYPEKLQMRLNQEGEKIFPLVKIPLARLWNLTSDSLDINFNLPEYVGEADTIKWILVKAQYRQSLSSQSASAQGDISWLPDRSIKIQQKLSEISPQLEAGKYYLGLSYQLSDSATSELNKVGFSDKSLETFIPIIVTEPVYMTWTIDWEGYDLSQRYMDLLTNMSREYKMPLTHYFNPRIYVNPSISAQRAQTLTNWVKERSQLGDEIGLHIHMHYDLIAAAGLTPKTEPRWGGRTEGHDVLTTAYNESEFTKILNWALTQFKAKGLPTPKGYRAGGWFLDQENMITLDKLGFTYDSSGTDYKEPYGPNKQSRSWNLSSTQRPYQVSRDNQNQSTPPLLNIWELPNNGADSTNRSSDELIKRLFLNIGTTNSPVQSAQILTYLSHPHWMNIDEPKMRALLNEAGKYKYEDDKGPIVFTTAINALELYR